MIKLKNLIKEVTYKWSTAHQPGIPSEVVDAAHKIIGVAHRDDPDTHPEFWMTTTQRPNLGMHAMDPNLVNKDVWYIDKPGKSNESRYWILSFNNANKHWQICYVKNGEIHRRADLNNQAAVDYVINKWVTGL